MPDRADERALAWHRLHVPFFKRKRSEDQPPTYATVATDAGMLARWRQSAFVQVSDYESWGRRHVNERLDEAIQQGELLPIGIQGDGVFGVRVAVAPDTLTEREARYTVVTSDAHLLASDGGQVIVSGVETVGDRTPRGWLCPWQRVVIPYAYP